MPPIPPERLLLIGCGILRRETLLLARKNDWPIDSVFLDSALHVDLDRLEHALRITLEANLHRRTIALYGCCHPRIDTLCATGGTLRTCGQNCIEMLLGHELYLSRLVEGAFFLLEDWVGPWERIVQSSLGTSNPAVIRDIFTGDRTHLLAVRTPCSRDFTAEAEAAGRFVGLPVRWLDVQLDHLDSVLQATITRKLAEAS